MHPADRHADQRQDGSLAAMQNSSVVSLLRERAGLQPDAIAFRYTDYEQYRQRGFTRLDA